MSIEIGVDEVGRGCLAGPVYAAAVVFQGSELRESVTDSKLLSENRREELSQLIWKHHWVGIGFADETEIDKLNILKASLLAMRRAVLSLEKEWKKSGYSSQRVQVLVDGKFIIPGLENYSQKAIVKGDLNVPVISAASIVAKVARDRWMQGLDEKFPGYEFKKHKGYGTPFHKEKIRKLGPTPIHRKSFAGVREYWIS